MEGRRTLGVGAVPTNVHACRQCVGSGLRRSSCDGTVASCVEINVGIVEGQSVGDALQRVAVDCTTLRRVVGGPGVPVAENGGKLQADDDERKKEGAEIARAE